MNRNKCIVCERIQMIKSKKNNYFVKELESGYVVLGDYQYYRGYTLLLSKIHTNELHKLGKGERLKFLEEMSLISEAVAKAFNPKKLNYELLGNSEPHLHWHIIPRYKIDPRLDSPIWVINPKIRCSKKTVPSKEQLIKMKKKLLNQLDTLINDNS